MLRHYEQLLIKVIRGEKKGVFSKLLRSGFWCLSHVYRVVVFFRNWAFDTGMLRQHYPPVSVVISVGNIVTGGAGKTPVTLMIAKQFYEDYTLAILSRGYRSDAEKFATPIVLSRGEGPMHPANYCGDEPYLLADNLPKALVFVGKDRHRSAMMAVEAGAQMVLLDDGMQHRRLARDFEVVVINGKDPFGTGHFLPRGFLRESVQSLRRADLIIINHVEDEAHYSLVKEKVFQNTQSLVIGTRVVVEKILDLNGDPIPSLNGKKVGVFCGLAHPQNFMATVEEQGAEVVACHFSGDHMILDLNQLARFAEECKDLGAEMLICSEKDKVKLMPDAEIPLPIVWIKMCLEIVEEQKHWSEFIDRVKERLVHSL